MNCSARWVALAVRASFSVSGQSLRDDPRSVLFVIPSDHNVVAAQRDGGNLELIEFGRWNIFKRAVQVVAQQAGPASLHRWQIGDGLTPPARPVNGELFPTDSPRQLAG